jgi:glycosyltransferase involved in cell wall biosynthesis
MSDVLLTLGLPVYNGSKCVQDTLRSINNALKKADPSKIEVLVSNNASEDNTFLVVQNLCNKLNLNISLYSEENNIQYDGNIDKIVRHAKGRYVWFIGCGETIKQDALCRVIKYLDIEYEYTNILLDFDIYDEVHGKCGYGIYDFDKKVILKGKNNFEYNRYAPAVSSNIVNKKLWMRVIKH